MKKILLALFLIMVSAPAFAQTSIWGATDREGTTTEMRLPVDTGASSSPGYISITPSSNGIVYNSGGNLITHPDGIILNVDNTGATDIAAAAEAFAENNLDENGDCHIVFPAGNYLINDFNPSCSVAEFRLLPGAVLKADAGHSIIAYYPGNSVVLDDEQTVSAISTGTVNRDDVLQRLTVSDASQYAAGEYVHIQSTNVSIPSDVNRWAGEASRVSQVDTINNYVYLTHRLQYAAELGSGTTKIWRYTGARKFNIYSEGTFSANGNIYNPAIYDRQPAIDIAGVVDSVIDGVFCDGVWSQCMIVRGTPGIKITDLKTRHLLNFATDNTSNTQYTISSVSQAAQGVVTTSAAPTELVDNDSVYIDGGTMTQLDGVYRVSDLSGSTFKLKDTNGNYINTSAYTAYVSGGYAIEADVTALGYGVSLYGTCFSCKIDGVQSGEGRHPAFTTDGRGSSYSADNTYLFGQPTYSKMTNIQCNGSTGPCTDLHEEGSALTISGVECNGSVRGRLFGSYPAHCVHVRAQSTNISNVRIRGGLYGIRYSAISHGVVPVHVLDDVSITDTIGASDGDTGIWVEDSSAITNKQVVFMDDVFMKNVGVPILADDDAVINASNLKFVDFDEAIDCNPGGYININGMSMDFRYQTRTGSTHHAFLMRSDVGDGGCEVVARNVHNIQGSGSNLLTSVCQEQDTTASKYCTVADFTEENPSAVTASNIMSTATTTFFRSTTRLTDFKSIKEVTAATYTLLRADSGQDLQFNRGTGQAVTLPNNMPVGWYAWMTQTGAGQTSYTAGAGATINSLYGSTVVIAAQYGRVLVFVDSNSDGSSAVYRISGDTVVPYYVGGTDVAIADGGTGQSTATSGFNALDPLTTKGDLIVHNGTDSTRIAIGTDGFLPVADSNAANGMAWYNTPARPNLQSSRYLIPPYAGTSTATLTLNILEAVPVYVKKRTAFTAAVFAPTTATNVLYKMGIYQDSGGIPGALVASSEVTSATTTVVAATNTEVAFSGTITLDTGWYWIAIVADTSSTINVINSASLMSLLGTADLTTTNVRYSKSFTYGTLPDPFSSGGAGAFSAATSPLLGLKLQ